MRVSNSDKYLGAEVKPPPCEDCHHARLCGSQAMACLDYLAYIGQLRQGAPGKRLNDMSINERRSPSERYYAIAHPVKDHWTLCMPEAGRKR